jgi:dihydrolipoamide dehydrogenase
MVSKTFDLIVIGAGPGGYVCAIRAAQLGLKTALVEKDRYLGGTCLNVGCIPSKALLQSTELYHRASHSEQHGISAKSVTFDLATMMARKSGVVDNLRRGVEALVKKRRITRFHGYGKLLGSGRVAVKSEDGIAEINAAKIVLATGSCPAELPSLKFDGAKIVSSDQAIAFETVPRQLVVVGGGAIGLELGSVWNRLGARVTIVEFLPQIAPTFDLEISTLMARLLKKQGMEINTDTRVTGCDHAGSDGSIIVQAEKKGMPKSFEADRVLVSVGRIPFNEGLGLEAVGVRVDKRGVVETDSHFETSVSGIHAIGDTIYGPMLAHKAEEEGVAVAEIIAGGHGEVNYDVIPNVIYTDPEMAAVGLTESEAKRRQIAVNTGKFPLAANGRAIASDNTDGIVKIVADKASDRILGVQIVSANASEMIASAVTHMEYGGSAEDLARTVHAHPTLSESLKEAALAVDGRAIHTL